MHQYPLPTVSEVLQTASGGKLFSKIDLDDAYLQVELDDESRKYVVFTTQKCIFRVNRLAFVLAAVPAIFQSIIEQILRPVPRTQPYLDDVLVTGDTEQQHIENLRQYFMKLRAPGIRLKRVKCKFFLHEVEHPGHVIDANGVRPSPSNARAIPETPAPIDLKSS